MTSLWYRGISLVALCSVPKLQAQEQYAYDQPASATTWENFGTIISELLLPNIFGAILLLALSAFFSSINFYKDVPSRQFNKGHRVGRYLAAWIVANYIFALLFLLLILPDNVSLSSVDKTLFVYCLIATALPELATNIKLSLGKTRESLDLYKYKEQLSLLISDRAKQSCEDYRSQQLVNLSYYYYDRASDFLDRLDIFQNQAELSAEESESLDRLKVGLEKDPIRGRAHRVLPLQREHMILVPRLLRFFESDIRKFNDSPIADLMKKLGPRMKIHEARALVDSGVTSSTWFLIRCHLPIYRRHLADRTGIERSRIDLLYHSSRFVARKRRRRGYAWVISTSFVLVLTVALFSWHESRTFGWTELPKVDAEALPQIPIEYAQGELTNMGAGTASMDTTIPAKEEDE